MEGDSQDQSCDWDKLVWILRTSCRGLFHSLSLSHTHFSHTDTYGTKLLRAAAEKASGAGSGSMRREIVYYSGFDCDICGDGDIIFAALRFKNVGCSTTFQSWR